jgi:hypothetical protein
MNDAQLMEALFGKLLPEERECLAGHTSQVRQWARDRALDQLLPVPPQAPAGESLLNPAFGAATLQRRLIGSAAKAHSATRKPNRFRQSSIVSPGGVTIDADAAVEQAGGTRSTPAARVG